MLLSSARLIIISVLLLLSLSRYHRLPRPSAVDAAAYHRADGDMVVAASRVAASAGTAHADPPAAAAAVSVASVRQMPP